MDDQKTSSSSEPTAAEKNQAAAPSVSSDTRYYSCDKEKLEALQKDKPWMKNPKHFSSVAVSPSAIMKMMMHCARGVEKGIAKGGNPIEVMGLLLGRPDPYHPTTLIVTDAFPLPIEGFETRVIADDQGVVNHMIALNESLELSRNEKFMGWYHSHPFDLGDHSHCFLSQTDLSTQLQWQRAEDPHGNPFVAMVLDPLRSTHQGIPELKAFRAFPPEYQSPISFECPDGSIEPSEKLRLEHWGSCWNRYYELGVEYYMSSTSRTVLEALTSNYLWISNLKRTTDPVDTLHQLQSTAAAVTKVVVGGGASSSTGGLLAPISAASTGAGPRDGSAMVIDPEPPVSGLGSAASSTEAASVGVIRGTTKDPSAWEPHLVESLSQVATQELAQATMAHVQRQVFRAPKSQ